MPPVAPAPLPGLAAARPMALSALEAPDQGLVAYLRNGDIVVEGLRPQAPRFSLPAPLALRTPSDADVAAALERARAVRQRDLHNLMHGGPLSRGPRPSVKDGSAHIDYMFTRCIGTESQLVTELACVGLREGFRVVVETDGLDHYGVEADVRRFIDEVPLPACFRTGEGARGEILGRRIPQMCGSWAEDDGEISADGVNIPAATLDEYANSEAVAEDRDRRNFGYFDMDRVGEVAREFRQYFKVRLAVSMQPPLPVREAISHIEGGNMLPYRRRDGDVGIVVGADSFAASIEAIARDCGLTFIDQDAKFQALEGRARAAIAADYDLRSPDHVIVGAQGAYHLDVHAFCNGDTIVVDDPDEAATVELDWNAFMASRPQPPGTRSMAASFMYERRLRDWQEERDGLLQYQEGVFTRAASRSGKLASFIDDLGAAGLSVSRFGGRFYKDAFKYNALSQENGTNPAGERYVILANTFVDSIREHVLNYYLKRAPIPYDRVYLLDANAGYASHQEGGGISCRCKGRTSPQTRLPSFLAFVAAPVDA